MRNFSISADNYFILSGNAKEKIKEVQCGYSAQYRALEIIEQYKDLRVLFCVGSGVMSKYFSNPRTLIKELKEIKEVSPNVGFVFENYQPGFIDELNDIILEPVHHSISGIVMAKAYMAVGLKEFYVTGPLAANTFLLKKLKDEGARIRIIPNVVQGCGPALGNIFSEDPLSCFWVIPEALHLYDDVVDTVEFAEGANHKELGSVEIYAREEYKGNIGDIIIDTTGKLNTIKNCYNDEIHKIRCECGLKCRTKKDFCHVCQLLNFENK